MKVNIPEDSASPRIWGKEILIVIVVICAALSFGLGYFVGLGQGEKKTVQPPVTGPTAPPAPAASAAQKPENPPVGQPQQSEAVVEKNPAAAVSKPQETALKETPAPAAPQKAPEQKAAPVKKEPPAAASKATPESASDPGTMFTVQLGAIKNPVEARRLRERLSKKGFKAIIVVAKNQKNEKIYKVRTGEFSDRKEAEVLALRLKKNEGLKAFVTPKNE